MSNTKNKYINGRTDLSAEAESAPRLTNGLEASGFSDFVSFFIKAFIFSGNQNVSRLIHSATFSGSSAVQRKSSFHFIKAVIILSITFGCLLNTFARPAAQKTPVPSSTSGGGTVVETPAATPEPSGTPSGVTDQARTETKRPAAEPTSRRYVGKDAPVRIPRFESAPVIDGKLDDAVWQTAALFGDFLQTQPGDNVRPTHPTEVMIGYDSKHLYMAFRVVQDRDKIRATVARRDNAFSDDFVGVYLDTFNDQRQAYVLFFNPLGIQGDGIFTEGRGEDMTVDVLMESKGTLTEDGFIVEVAIPFKSLRYEAGKNKNWGIHIFRRVKYSNNELNSWMPNNRSISGSLNQAGRITGLEGIETTRQLEINPSMTLSQEGRRTRYTFDGDPAGRFVNDGVRGDFGFTAKFGLTPTTTLDFAFNPDFAQVEADAPVTTANQRFPIFFAEKRPFFLERIDIFQTPMNIVNTRAIVDPDVAAKITGRRGKNTFGLLYASDNAPGNYSKDERESLRICQQRRLANPSVVCGLESFMDKNANIGVLRVKRDIGRQSNLGFFATSYNFVERHNYTGGLDGRIRLSPRIVGDFQVVATHSRRFFYDADQNKNIYRSGNGFGYHVWGERTGRNLYMNYMASGRTRDYRADVGFTRRVDTNYLGSFVRYETDRDPKKSIIYKRIHNGTNITYDWQGRSQGIQSNTQGMLALQRQTYVGGGTVLGYERVFEHEFGAKRKEGRQGAFIGPDSERSTFYREVYGFVETTPNKQLFGLFVTGYRQGQLDYDLGAGRKFHRVSPAYLAYLARRASDPTSNEAPPAYDPGPGDQFFIEASIRYRPLSVWQVQLNYNKSRLVRHDTDRVAFDDNIYSLRTTYQFSRDVFTRVRVDYSTLAARIRPQVVFGWTPSPGTAFYAGYNGDMSHHGFNPFTGQHEPGLRRNGSTFFIKASYLFKKSF